MNPPSACLVPATRHSDPDGRGGHSHTQQTEVSSSQSFPSSTELGCWVRWLVLVCEEDDECSSSPVPCGVGSPWQQFGDLRTDAEENSNLSLCFSQPLSLCPGVFLKGPWSLFLHAHPQSVSFTLSTQVCWVGGSGLWGCTAHSVKVNFGGWYDFYFFPEKETIGQIRIGKPLDERNCLDCGCSSQLPFCFWVFIPCVTEHLGLWKCPKALFLFIYLFVFFCNVEYTHADDRPGSDLRSFPRCAGILQSKPLFLVASKEEEEGGWPALRKLG